MGVLESLKPHFGDVSENASLFSPPVLNSHSEVSFTSLTGLQPRKKK